MKIIKKDFDPESNEYSIELLAQDMRMMVWLSLDVMNQLVDDEFFDICKCIFNITIEEPSEGGETLIDLEGRFFRIFWNIDITNCLNIDSIDIIDEKEFNEFSLSQKNEVSSVNLGYSLN